MSSISPSRRWLAAGWFSSLLIAAAILAPPARSQDPDTLGLSYVRDVQVGSILCPGCPRRICPDRPVVVTVSGWVPDGCVQFRGLSVMPLRQPSPWVIADFVVDSCGVACPRVITSFVASVELPALPPGGSGAFRLLTNVRSCPDTSVIARSDSRDFTYQVEESCADIPPIDSLVRSFVGFRVEPELRCDRDTLSLRMFTNGCPPCVRLVSLVSDSAYHATFAWTPTCIEPLGPTICLPQSLTLPLGQFVAGFHQLFVDVDVQVRNTDTGAIDSTISFRENVLFEVATCDSAQACVYPVLVAGAPATDPAAACNVDLQPGGRGSLVLRSRSGVALGGLQGQLFCPEPFRVVGLTAPPDLPGIHVSWVADGRGARFVLFTTGGLPIPPGDAPVLWMEVECDTGAVAGTRGEMYPVLTVASGPAGEDVPICGIRRALWPTIGLCVAGTRQACDVNEDGHPDVRDLVIMTNCLRLELPPGGTAMCRDCNGDGSWAFGDLLCCAHHILQLPIVPRDSVNADDIRATLDPLASDEQGLLVRVRLSGVGDLGAALLRLRYPGGRWQASFPVTVDLASAASDGWLPIIDPGQPGVVQLGGLRLTETASADLDFVLRFTPTGVPQPEDQVVVEGADLAGSDGTAFTLAVLPSMTLSTPGPGPLPSRVELGAARPNPFARSTVFTMSLPREADVDLAVHDLAGRRIVTLLSGRVAAGQREVAWQADAARNGVYFVRLVVDGKVYTQRVALLRDRR